MWLVAETGFTLGAYDPGASLGLQFYLEGLRLAHLQGCSKDSETRSPLPCSLPAFPPPDECACPLVLTVQPFVTPKDKRFV